MKRGISCNIVLFICLSVHVVTGVGCSKKTNPRHAVAVGSTHACALDWEGRVACWGDAEQNQFDGMPVYEQQFESLFARGNNTCAIERKQHVAYCWGSNRQGQLHNMPQEPLLEIAMGLEHVCGIRQDRTLSCFGNFSRGQNNDLPPPLTRFLHATCGNYHCCGILYANGSVLCWGDKTQGQREGMPDSGVRFKAISAGSVHTAAIDVSGHLWLWGNQQRNQTLGVPTINAEFVDVWSGGYHTCVQRPNLTVYCFGDNSVKQVQMVPQDIAWQVWNAGSWNSCGLNPAGRIACYGDESQGQTVGLPPQTLWPKAIEP